MTSRLIKCVGCGTPRLTWQSNGDSTGALSNAACHQRKPKSSCHDVRNASQRRSAYGHHQDKDANIPTLGKPQWHAMARGP